MQTPAFGPLKSQLQSIPRRTVFVSNRPLPVVAASDLAPPDQALWLKQNDGQLSGDHNLKPGTRIRPQAVD
jgi:hypothetical protein